MNGLERIRDMVYPGRFIVLGRDSEGKNVLVYGMTGRKDCNRARTLSFPRNGIDKIIIKPTSKSTASEGDPEYTIYTPIIMNNDLVAVGNGNQVGALTRLVQYTKPLTALREVHRRVEPIPNGSAYTPRISGVMNLEEAALGIVRCAKNMSIIRKSFRVPLEAGHGKFISTYKGEDIPNPISFDESPFDVSLEIRSAQETAELFYGLLTEKYRVAVAAFHIDKNGGREVAIVDKRENGN